jgi:tRNA-specific adenosine deaminase 1
MSGVTKEMEGKWGGGYGFKEFLLRTTEREFVHSRRSVLETERAISCNISAVYTPHFQESLIGGVLQGRKQFDPRGASALSRRSMWKAVVQIMRLVSALSLKCLPEAGFDPAAGKGIEIGMRTYKDLKESEALRDRRRVKSDVQQILKGWVRNSGDDDFSLNLDDIGSRQK